MMSETKKIHVELEKIEDEHFIVFKFEEPLKLNLKSSKHEDIRGLFSKLITNLLDEDFDLEYVKETSVTEVLVKEVAEEYISQLSIDLNSIKSDQDFIKFKQIKSSLD
ncbi:MAG: hypothetical protein A2Y45_06215 [Tenericutes bacterium GWC2_34_14]|nr:MAG: hypothetical protein A2Z84_00470 [Tenericutes bacterium GWA2_35_7]OHE28549.1 MAG: hypothetical protein A2Y45_06215 [Tenericutes bacterium GWC2_34_14]OHE33543.1 MAG: hypothetical protein A2012_03595 [Tenericutes bacterium GWE2_34_108]OHE36828.1 MAG: hypothetical protein A2Y46_09395 [Tenericutes bacterium GWF1_35_14]OHE38092.1 MAG: hypothetical protein A2Y44_09270 [Tenericutes bacterium GWF2_35_184]OHE43391.1 MAG: hypothetical protein A2221_06465 [Tenericutes bacterium RIFOXYA2_FULL_36_3